MFSWSDLPELPETKVPAKVHHFEAPNPNEEAAIMAGPLVNADGGSPLKSSTVPTVTKNRRKKKQQQTQGQTGHGAKSSDNANNNKK